MIKKELIILGCADSVGAAKDIITDSKFEVWGMNNLMKDFPEFWERADAWFDLHDFKYMAFKDAEQKLSPGMYRTADMPIYLIKKASWAPTSLKFPFTEIFDYLDKPSHFFNSSLASILAFALMQNTFTQIQIHGVELPGGTVYERQRPTIYYLIGRFEERGIEIILPEDCKLLEVQDPEKHKAFVNDIR